MTKKYTFIQDDSNAASAKAAQTPTDSKSRPNLKIEFHGEKPEGAVLDTPGSYIVPKGQEIPPSTPAPSFFG